MLEIPWLFVLLIMALCGFTVFLFLPSILELKHPRDHGPRQILGDQIKGIDETIPSSPRLEIPVFLKGYIPENLQQTIMNLDGTKISKIDADTTKIVGDMEFPSGIEIAENIVVEGHLTIGDESHFHGSVQASETVNVGCNVIVEKDLLSGKDITVDRNTVINGALNAKGSVHLGRNALVGLSLSSGRNVELGQGARVAKKIISGGFIVSHENPKP